MLKKISKLITEPVISLKPEGKGWYTVIRAEQPDSTRYSVFFKQKLAGLVGLLYDRKVGKTQPFSIEPADIKKYKVSTTDTKPNKTPEINESIIKLLEKGTVRDANGYLAECKLDSFIEGNETWRALKHKTSGDAIIVPYTTWDYQPQPIGGQLYLANKKKQFFSGGYRGSFHPHKYSTENTLWILGEGFRDCFLAAKIIPSANILEVGGLSKYKPVIQYILRVYPEHKIILLGEKGVEEQLAELTKLSPYISLSYPTNEKDFADEYKRNPVINTIRDEMLGNDIKKEGTTYKPLGIADNNLVIYSKFLNTVVTLNPDKSDQIIRNCIKLKGFESWTPLDKKIVSSHVWENCVRSGIYQKNELYGRGLWKHKEDLYFNTGANLYHIKPNIIRPVQFMDKIANDFLIIKTPTNFPELIETEFEPYIETLDNVLRDCDWVKPFHGSLLFGFMVQSLFAGTMRFRTNMWISSDRTTSGKSWLSSWLRDNLMPITEAIEGDMSSAAGVRQSMSNSSVMLHLDEIAEEGTTFEIKAKEMIQLLRSSSGGNNRVTLGTAQQQSIAQRVKFSTLMSCISGREWCEEQDSARIIDLRMKRGSKVRFGDKIKPRFQELEGKLEGFTAYCLKNYHLFQDFYREYEKKFAPYTGIGHRIRGLSAVVAGYALLYKDINKGFDLIEEIIDDNKLIEPIKREDEEKDFVGQLLYRIIDSKFLPFGDDSCSFLSATQQNLLKCYGISLDENTLKICIKRAIDLLNRAFFRNNLSPDALRRYLQSSKYYTKDTRARVDGVRSYFLLFDLSSELEDEVS